MKKNDRLPQRRDANVEKEPFTLARKMFEEIEKMFNDDQWATMFTDMAEQLKVEETDSDYHISVKMQGIEDPGDVHYQYKNGQLYLQRSMEVQNKKNLDGGMVWQSHTEHFSRTVPLARPIHWQEREVSAGKGIWKIRIPKV